MDYWQISLLALFVLLPVALAVGFWPERERLTRAGEPAERRWRPQVEHEPHDEHH